MLFRRAAAGWSYPSRECDRRYLVDSELRRRPPGRDLETAASRSTPSTSRALTLRRARTGPRPVRPIADGTRVDEPARHQRRRFDPPLGTGQQRTVPQQPAARRGEREHRRVRSCRRPAGRRRRARSPRLAALGRVPPADGPVVEIECSDSAGRRCQRRRRHGRRRERPAPRHRRRGRAGSARGRGGP